ncbi:type I restriction enzyme S subunit [Algoriphagus aquaeductus]|uniref:Type I restriction enzyme S subunit n=1 Tax=Algoriphagus aquaeductus TaxID=475299 RepID=A0A326RYP8_9BACT|nr:restriction endonuclease subunit S [Algoriphagus aquaeductus]PZV87439.1 type I restriction enzyme S subunit [Algoriphagus aquaeductus]
MSAITKKLIEVCEDIVMGQSPESSSYNSFGIGLPFFQGKTEFGKHYPVPVKWCSSPKKIAKDGDILMSVRAPVGATNIANQECCIGRGLAAIRVNPEKMDRDFLLLQLKHLEKALIKKGTGSTFEAIGSDVLYDLEVFAPDLEIQQSIGKELVNQLSEIEKAREATEIINQDIKRLKHLALHDFLSEFNKAEKFKLGAKAVTTSGSTPSRGQKDYWQPAEIPWIKTGEIAFAPITKSEEYVSAKALKECSLKLLPVNTVLIAMYGQGKTRGQSAILKVPATINQACFAILPNETWDAEFLQLWLMYSYQDMRNMSENRGGNQANLNGDLLNSFEVPAPPIEVQREVVKNINAALTELETMKASWQNTAEEIKTLPNRLLAQAFNEIKND